MKDKKFWVLVVFAVIVIFVILYFSAPLEKTKPLLPAAGPGAETINKLESQLEQLKNVIHSFVESNLSLQKEFSQTKENLGNLEQSFKDSIFQNETLLGELSQLRAGMELTASLRDKLKALDASLADLKIKSPQQIKDVTRALQSIDKKLNSIDRSVPGFLKENKSYKKEAQILSGLLEKKKEELSLLEQKAKQDLLKKEMLEKDLNSLSAQLKKTGGASNLLEKQIADSKDAVENLKTSNNVLSKRNAELEKELDALKGELSQINKERQIIIKEVESANTAARGAQKLEQELAQLEAQLGQLNKDYIDLKYDYKKTQEALRDNELELGRRADRILKLQEELSGTQVKLSETEARSKEIEKEGALLREQYVALGLERENMRGELGQVKLKLTELQNKFKEMGSIFNFPKAADALSEAVKPIEAGTGKDSTEGENLRPPDKKVDVQLLLENEPETKK